jgi:DNA-binding Lrp family transcriptional regulator
VESLKPQDVLVILKICSLEAAKTHQKGPSMAWLGAEVGLSSSEVHAAIRRLRASGLLQPEIVMIVSPRGSKWVRGKLESVRPNTTALSEFLVHGLKYVFPATRGELTRGVPTSYAAAPLKKFIAKGRDLPPVWPYSEGKVRGTAFEPLYRTVPFAASRDRALYELLAIVDALRDGRARERKLAEKELIHRLGNGHDR